MANTGEPRYWVYTHDEDDSIVESIGYFDTLSEALIGACEEITGIVMDTTPPSALTVRVVDNEKDGTTIWMAGPVPKKEV